MAQMYFYKFNINSEIYDVYANEDLQQEILMKVFESITQDSRYSEESRDSDGEERTVQYKFCDLEKDIDNLEITGRLVKIFDGEVQSYNRTQDTVETRFEEDRAASATFCFDLLHEEIAFITRMGLGYLQFGKYFKNLLEVNFPENSFELILEKNVGELRNKIYGIARILKVSSVIIPPNANEAEFEALLGTSVDEFKETKATRYTQGLEVSKKGKGKINPKTKFFERIFYAAGKGYAEISVEGRDNSNEKVVVNSDSDAPYKTPVPEKEKDSIISFKEHANAKITQLLRDKAMIRLENVGESDESSNGEGQS